MKLIMCRVDMLYIMSTGRIGYEELLAVAIVLIMCRVDIIYHVMPTGRTGHS